MQISISDYFPGDPNSDRCYQIYIASSDLSLETQAPVHLLNSHLHLPVSQMSRTQHIELKPSYFVPQAVSLPIQYLTPITQLFFLETLTPCSFSAHLSSHS